MITSASSIRTSHFASRFTEWHGVGDAAWVSLAARRPCRAFADMPRYRQKRH